MSAAEVQRPDVAWAAPNLALLLLAATAAAALAATGLVAHAPNRLISGVPLSLWQVASAPRAAAIATLAAFLIAAALLPARPRREAAVIAAAAALMLLVLDSAGTAAATLAAVSPPAARTSLGAGFWIATLAAALAIVDATQRLGAAPAARLLVAAVVAGLVVALAVGGRLDALSLAREYAIRRGAFEAELVRHCALVVGALVPALVIGVPLGLLAARRPRARAALFAVLNLIQTIPSIALFGLLIAPLAAVGIGGIGVVPALIALALYALLPVARNTEAGIRGVDRAVIESARGMGMTGRQIFWRIELPLGLPVFLAGVRIVTVQAIGLATVAALIGAGGLGTFVFQGIGQYAVDLVLLGAVPTILLALAADLALALLIEALSRRRHDRA